MKETPIITAESTSYPEKVDAFVEHNLSGAEEAWPDEDFLYTLFYDHFSNLPMTCAISEYYLKDWVFRDSVLIDEMEIDETALLTDKRRIEFAQHRLSRISGELIEEPPMLMLALILDSGGREITIVMSAMPAGQAGVIVDYDALKNATNISDALEHMGMIATDDLDSISPDWILSRWTRDVNAL